MTACYYIHSSVRALKTAVVCVVDSSVGLLTALLVLGLIIINLLLG
jgi:hypothetical protein